MTSLPWKCNKCKHMYVGIAHCVMRQPVNWLSIIEYVAVSEESQLQHVLFWVWSFIFIQYCALLRPARLGDSKGLCSMLCSKSTLIRRSHRGFLPPTHIVRWRSVHYVTLYPCKQRTCAMFALLAEECNSAIFVVAFATGSDDHRHLPINVVHLDSWHPLSVTWLPWLSIAFNHWCDTVYEVTMFVCCFLIQSSQWPPIPEINVEVHQWSLQGLRSKSRIAFTVYLANYQWKVSISTRPTSFVSLQGSVDQVW